MKTLMLCLLAFSANAELVEQPQVELAQKPTITAKLTVTDVDALEDAAITVLLTEHGLTFVEAQAITRVDGKVDVARCMEYIINNAMLYASKTIQVESLQIALPHELVDRP